MMTTIAILAIVLLSGAVLVALAFGLFRMLYRLFGKKSGLNKLAQLYPADHLAGASVDKKQKVGVDGVGFRNSADIGITPAGLYLWIHPFLSKYDPVLIPWDELSNPQPATLALRRAVRLVIGKPRSPRSY